MKLFHWHRWDKVRSVVLVPALTDFRAWGVASLPLLEKMVDRTSIVKECSCGALREFILEGDHRERLAAWLPHEHSFKVKSVALVGPAIKIDKIEGSGAGVGALLASTVQRTSVARECSCGEVRESVLQGDHTKAFKAEP
jgi:hypothetical protein